MNTEFFPLFFKTPNKIRKGTMITEKYYDRIIDY